MGQSSGLDRRAASSTAITLKGVLPFALRRLALSYQKEAARSQLPSWYGTRGAFHYPILSMHCLWLCNTADDWIESPAQNAVPDSIHSSLNTARVQGMSLDSPAGSTY
jgi:hypothetical protein